MQQEIQCQRCTACCRWPGEVRVDENEIQQIAAFKGMSEQEFIERHTRLRKDRLGLALNEQPDGSCIFLENGGCTIHSVKPQQCKDFPTRWVNALWGKVPPETIQRDYPMLFACAAFKAFKERNS